MRNSSGSFRSRDSSSEECDLFADVLRKFAAVFAFQKLVIKSVLGSEDFNFIDVTGVF